MGTSALKCACGREGDNGAPGTPPVAQGGVAASLEQPRTRTLYIPCSRPRNASSTHSASECEDHPYPNKDVHCCEEARVIRAGREIAVANLGVAAGGGWAKEADVQMIGARARRQVARWCWRAGGGSYGTVDMVATMKYVESMTSHGREPATV